MITLNPARRGYQLLLLVAAATSASYGRTLLSPLQETLRTGLALTDNEISIIQGPALALPMVVLSLPLGLIIDHWSRRQLLLILALGVLAGSIATGFATTFPALLVARSLVGFCAFAVNPTVLSMLADLYPPTLRGRTGMTIAFGQLGGMAVAFALGGVAAGYSDQHGFSVRQSFIWLSIPPLCVLATLFATEEPPHTRSDPTGSTLSGSLAQLWHYRASITPLLVGIVAAEVALGALLVWTAPSFSRSLSLKPESVGILMASVLVVSGTIGPLAGGTLADRCHRTGGPRRTAATLAALAFISIPAALFPVLETTPLAVVVLVTYVTVASSICVMGAALFTVVVPPDLRGLCLALLSGTCVLFGNGVAPVAVSLLSPALGGGPSIARALAIVCLATALVGTFMFSIAARYFRSVSKDIDRQTAPSINSTATRG